MLRATTHPSLPLMQLLQRQKPHISLATLYTCTTRWQGSRLTDDQERRLPCDWETNAIGQERSFSYAGSSMIGQESNFSNACPVIGQEKALLCNQERRFLYSQEKRFLHTCLTLNRKKWTPPPALPMLLDHSSVFIYFVATFLFWSYRKKFYLLVGKLYQIKLCSIEYCVSWLNIDFKVSWKK